MKKNTAVFNIILTSFVLSIGFLPVSKSLAESTNPQAPDPDRDHTIPTPQADRISALIESLSIRRLDHQIQTLEADEESFLTLYRPSLTNSTQGCVILLHSDNEHPDWPDAVSPLRNALPEHSWCTISIEVPDIIKRAKPIKFEENTQEEGVFEGFTLPNQEVVFARIQASIAKANSEDIQTFVFLGYKTGASYVLNFLADNPESAAALALIDIEPPAGVSHYQLAQKMREIAQPTLDYYTDVNAGSNQFATWRKQAANQRTGAFGEYTLLDSRPDRATGKDKKQLLLQRVRGFLKQNTQQINQRKPLPVFNKGLFYETPF